MEEVIHLGFDSAVEDLGALCSATNRAVAQLRRELCPATGRFMVNVRKPVGCTGEEITFDGVAERGVHSISAVAITFECIGKGILSFETDGVAFRDETIAAPEWRAYKFIFADHRGARVVLKNAEGLRVRNIAVFDGVDYAYTPETLPIITGSFAKFDAGAFCDDFITLDEDPYNEMGVAVRGYEVYGKQLSLPIGAGRVEVTYRRKIREATMDDFADGKITVPDVPEEYADMLPLCVASYVWADVEPEKAAHYRQMYNEQLQYAKLQQKHRGRSRVIDRKGWR